MSSLITSIVTLTTNLTVSQPTGAVQLNLSSTPTFTSLTLSGSPLGVSSGGTGQTTASLAINALVPSQTGNAGKALITNGTVVAWTSVTATAGGSSTQVQYNSSGSLAANSGFTSDGSGNVGVLTLNVTSSTNSTSHTTGCVTLTGGLGISMDLNIAGAIYVGANSELGSGINVNDSGAYSWNGTGNQGAFQAVADVGSDGYVFLQVYSYTSAGSVTCGLEGPFAGTFFTGSLAYGGFVTGALSLQLATNSVAAVTINSSQKIQFNAYGSGSLYTDSSGNISASSMTTAPSTTPLLLTGTINVYGSVADLLGAPTTWESVVVGGTTYKRPLY